jgi:Tol biopolymer transport system component
MNLDGSGVRRLTNRIGYDGGAFFSPDSQRIVYRASYPRDEKSKTRYQALLAEHLVEPRQLDLFVMNSDGSNPVQVTDNQAANFCPFFHPSGKKIIFASNLADPRGRNFDLYLINLDGTGLERITFHETFDGFPMFSPDGKRLVLASNRNGTQPGETNIFVADWVE